MDQCTHKVRMQHWMNVISQCQNREEGTSIKQWLKDHGIRQATYHLWQRRIRQEAYARMDPSAVIRTASMTIALSADIPDSLLTRILRARYTEPV